MKKLISLILAAALIACSVFAFASCGKEEEEDNVLTCGVTIFEKFNEQDANGNWTGFECDFARAVGEIIGMEVEFQKIDWTQKYNELAAGTIDCIWNGFTANSSDNGKPRTELVDFTYGYMLNQQCVVIKKDNADIYKTAADLDGKTAGVEGGSAGESYAAEFVGENGKLEKYPAQNNAFLEIKTGAVDFAVVDILLAKNICGNGDYADLMIVEDIVLDSEIYAIGFEKGSELTAKVNEAIKTLFENGTMLEIAKRYGLENSLQFIETIE